MSKGPLGNILEEERRAEDQVKKANIAVKKMRGDAEQRIARRRREEIGNFNKRREQILSEARSRSSKEASRIKREGIDTANKLKNKVRARIPEISEKITKWYLGKTK